MQSNKTQTKCQKLKAIYGSNMRKMKKVNHKMNLKLEIRQKLMNK